MNGNRKRMPRPTWQEVVAAHGNLTKRSKEFVGPCPVCGGTDRFSVRIRDDMMHCRSCLPGKSTPEERAAYRILLEALGLSGEREACWVKPVIVGNQTADDKFEIDKAQRLLNAGIPIRNTPAAEYLKSRGLDPDNDQLRYIPNALHGGLKQRLPCLLAPVICPLTGNLIAVQRYFFTAKNPDDRKRVTGRPRGGGALLAGSLDAQTIVVTEGLADALSIIQCGADCAVWAVGGKGNFRWFKFNPNLKALLVAADREKEAIDEAAVIARKGRKEGLLVKLVAPPPKLGDWNDLLKNGRCDLICKIVCSRVNTMKSDAS